MTQKENGIDGRMEKSEISVAFYHRLYELANVMRIFKLRWRFEQPCCGSVVAHPTLYFSYIFWIVVVFSLLRFQSNHLLPVVATRRIWLYGIIHDEEQTTRRSAIIVSHNALSSRNVWINAGMPNMVDISHAIYCPQTANWSKWDVAASIERSNK